MEQPIRILQVLGKLNRGGAEAMIMELYRHVDRNLVQFDFVEHTDEICAYEDEIKALGGTIYRFPRYRGYNHLDYTTKWKQFFEQHKEYQVVHCHIRSTASLICKIAKRQGRHTIVHSHNTNNGGGLSAFVKKLLQKNITGHADYLFACSSEAGRWLFGKQIEKNDRFRLFHNAVDSKKFAYSETSRVSAREALGLDDDALVVGTVGRLTEQKNPYGILDIIERLHQVKPEAKMLWIGTGELAADIQQKIQEKSLSNVVLMLGARSDVASLMQAMDVFILPSFWEGLPVVGIEAQAAGLPSLLSDQISPEVVITDCCKQIPLEPLDRWVQEILEASSKPHKPMQAEIVAAGYDIDDTSKMLQDLYLELHGIKRG